MSVLAIERPAFTAVDHFAEWCNEACVQSVDRWAGLPLALEEWQLDFLAEALSTDDDGLPFWATVALVVPRKNGKSVMLGAYALYHLVNDPGSPEVLLTASSDKQAGRLFDAVTSFIRRSPKLREELVVREYVGEVARADGQGKILRMSSDPNRLHGWNPSRVVVDELHAWTTPSLRKAFAALTTAGGARSNTQVLIITTAGEAEEREESILGHLIDANESRGEVEERGALRISRNFEARTLVFNYTAPVAGRTQREQREDFPAVRAANPASWVTDAYLRRQIEAPDLSDAEFLQLHGCVWAQGASLWLAEEWDGLRDETAVMPEGTEVFVGVDVGLTNDTTAVDWAGLLPDGRIVLRSHVWAAIPDVAAHERVPGGRVRLEPVEAFILSLAEQGLAIREVVYDPRFFEQNAQNLSDAGLSVAPLEQQGKAWDDATTCFYRVARAGELAHDGDEVLRAHVRSTVAEKTERGWKLRKLKAMRKIDACVAGVMAVWRASQSQPSGYVMVLGDEEEE